MEGIVHYNPENGTSTIIRYIRAFIATFNEVIPRDSPRSPSPFTILCNRGCGFDWIITKYNIQVTRSYVRVLQHPVLLYHQVERISIQKTRTTTICKLKTHSLNLALSNMLHYESNTFRKVSQINNVLDISCFKDC